jgi:DNA-directed RNA polymerase specialized sigma24 family protein
MIRNLRFTLICRRHCDEVYRYARSILGNAADAEEAVEEVLLRQWGRGESNPRLSVRSLGEGGIFS